MDEAAIARLVLGYLREEGCRGACKDFLKASRHLQSSKFSSSKYVPTRFVGLTLNDILKEYYEIYQTVQGRLEATNYFKEPHSNTSLLHQLVYLLNNRRQSSRASTPCFRSPGDSHFGETSPVYTDHVSDVETTPAHKLPGNIQYESEESNISDISRKKNRSRISDDFQPPKATDGDRSTEVVFDAEILAQTLLENKELPEKIAQTINKVAEKKPRFSTELNETIQTVVKETAQDPIFDQILEEIIGSATIVDSVKSSESHSSKNTHGQNENIDTHQKLQKKLEKHENCEKQFQVTPNKTVEEQNAEAVQSIIDTAKTSETQIQQAVVYNGKSDVIVFDGSLDKYILSNSCSIPAPVQQPQTPFVLNTNGSLFMVPSTISANITSTPGNQYYILNKPPLLNCYIPPSTVLSEKDILAMPTVIVNDDKPAVKSTKKSKGLSKIHPKPQIDISSNASLSEFLTLNKRKDEPKADITNLTEMNRNFTAPNKKESVLTCSTDDPKPVSDMSNILQEGAKEVKQKVSDVPIITPPQTGNPKKSTPKSGSHIRNLNFTTPPKIIPTDKNKLKISHSDKKTVNSKKQAAKMLFKKDDKHSIVDKNSEEDLPWDANLRSYLPNYDTSKKKSPKFRKTNKLKKNNATNANNNLNTTDQDGALLEAALKTPIKTQVNEVVEEKTEKKSEPETKQITSKLINKDFIIVHNNVEKKNLKDVTNEGHKTVLSPSKLNANKRNLMNNTVGENNDKFLTPEVLHDSITYPIKANRNIIPMLETPVKADVPRTPGSETPSEFNMSSLSNFTPVAKMLEANLTDFDVNLPTPNIPITPSFPPFTPTVDLMSPYSNRPTDYSTSSSYYQPSDNEQNKSLEAQLLEVEKKPLSDETRNDVRATQLLDIFNKNVIGKKNLNLVKRTETTCSGSSSSSSSSSSDASEDENESCFTGTEKESNDTVICKKKSIETPRKTYSLRNRSISAKTLSPKLCMDKDVSLTVETNSVKITKQVKTGHKTPKKVVDNKSVNAEKSFEEIANKNKNKNYNSFSTKNAAFTKIVKGRTSLIGQENVLKELEEKRQRTINKFKNNESSPTVKQKKCGRFIKIKPIANVSHQRKRSRKSDFPKKNVNKIDSNSLLNTLRKDLADSDGETEDDISLRLSVSEDEEKIQHATEKRIKNLEKIDKSASDVEAQTLIEGLRERGIHLMHNKSTNGQNSGFKTSQNMPESEGNTMNNSETKGVNTLNNSENEQKKDGPSLNYSFPARLDTCVITDEICYIFNDSKCSNQIIESNNQNDELKLLRARLYIEEIQKEIDIKFKLTDFHLLLDINPLKDYEINDDKTYQDSFKKKTVNKNTENQESDDTVKKEKEERLSESQSPPSSKKRKYQDDEESAHKEKKCKTLLKIINVDSFLNNIHGNK